jgi:hypothetical protein
MILVKSASKKSFAQKNDFFRTFFNFQFSIAKIVFWQKLFLGANGALFTKVICTFLKTVRKDGRKGVE